MNITYICHSGFLVETASCYYLFDYSTGSLPHLDPFKPIFVFSSHGHADHYNPHVFSMLEEYSIDTIIAVLSNDIPKKRYPAGYLPLVPDNSEAAVQTFSLPVFTPDPASTTASVLTPGPDFAGTTRQKPSPGHFLIKVYHSREYILPCGTQVQTLLSTDKGVAYLVTCPEGVLYHAGDLNDWSIPETPEKERKQMRGSFRASLSRLKGLSIDAAFLPLDPRLGDNYAEGFLYFLQTVSAKKVYPMHFWNQPKIVCRFLEEHPEYAGVIDLLGIR